MSEERRDGSVILKLREKLLSISDDYWIEDEHGTQVYKVDGKVLRVGKKAVLQDPAGQEVCTVQHKMAHLHRTFEVTRGDQPIATVQQKIMTVTHKHKAELADGSELEISGSIGGRKFEVERDGRPIARALHTWFKVRDTVGIEVFDPADAPLVLGIMIAVDMAEQFDRNAMV